MPRPSISGLAVPCRSQVQCGFWPSQQPHSFSCLRQEGWICSHSTNNLVLGSKLGGIFLFLLQIFNSNLQIFNFLFSCIVAAGYLLPRRFDFSPFWPLRFCHDIRNRPSFQLHRQHVPRQKPISACISLYQLSIIYIHIYNIYNLYIYTHY